MKTYIFKPVVLIVTIMIVGLSGYHAAGRGAGRPSPARPRLPRSRPMTGEPPASPAISKTPTICSGPSIIVGTGPSPNVTNLTTYSGKADINFNTYCGSVVRLRRIACWSCHVGNGKVPKATLDSPSWPTSIA